VQSDGLAVSVQVPRRPIIHIRSFQEQAGRRCSNPHAHHSPSPFNQLDAACTAPTRVRENVRLHQRLHHLFSFSLRHSFHTLVAIIHSLQVPLTVAASVLAHDCTLSTTHTPCVRLTLTCQSIDLARPSRRLAACDTNLQFPDFSSPHAFSKSKPITPPLSTSRPSLTCS
jgi:hypothetical protein